MDSRKLLRLIEEYNDQGHLVFLDAYPGAHVRGRTRAEALKKIPAELDRYRKWSAQTLHPLGGLDCQIVQSKRSELAVEDADSSVLFDSERELLTVADYTRLKALVLKSARDFLSLTSSIPDRDRSIKASRRTFYGDLSVTASAMYEHTRRVNHFYFAELGFFIRRNEDLLTGREEGFLLMERSENYLNNVVTEGGDGELWSLRKLLRRFLWHDAIHAKALYRSACRAFPESLIANPFGFFL